MKTATLRHDFTEIFHTPAQHTYFAPGRINLIGEYTDFNGGHVFPCAISLGTYAAVAGRDDQTIRLYSANFPDAGILEFTLDDLVNENTSDWDNYAKGMVKFIQAHGYTIKHGFDAYLQGDLPNAAGLSSSASIEMLFGEILNDLNDFDIDPIERVKIGVETENKFIGVQSGIMDQFAVQMGQAEQAVLLDTNTLDYELIPIKLGNYVIVIMNTNKRRALTDSKYNERRSQCEAALAKLQTNLAINSLGDLNNEQFDENTYLIDDETLIKRARHAVSENQRTLLAAAALQDNDLETFGKLVNASHISLKYDFEVSGKELDTLVASAWQQPGVLGARMTGAGFGGCAIAIVAKDQLDDFEHNVGTAYRTAIGYDADFYVAEIADGPKRLD
ncbi:galactokinase [Lactobacillus selangorensis]|uniref:Galactokinase n=1 Tax=Lactobacillus selangorensis TaxID=81857 RepID=A0A0R2GA77_9LACO|nr:galactokinase [Lactobacillus selangorensis]KRN29285.1 galactokinase [Lactobacillus selangorensis]KRN34186.1 galactokinase [Lactobacillus selangorensis]